jgi:hypothetical protein
VSARLGNVNGNRLTEYERWQADVGAYTDRLVGAVVASGQYAGAEIRHATREFIIFAMGEPSPPVAAVLQQAPDIVRITWRRAPYTQAELTSEMRRIMSRFHGRLTSGGARHDGTGIELTTTDAQLLGAPDPRAVLECRYPVTIEYGEPPVTH